MGRQGVEELLADLLQGETRTRGARQNQQQGDQSWRLNVEKMQTPANKVTAATPAISIEDRLRREDWAASRPSLSRAAPSKTPRQTDRRNGRAHLRRRPASTTSRNCIARSVMPRLARVRSRPN